MRFIVPDIKSIGCLLVMSVSLCVLPSMAGGGALDKPDITRLKLLPPGPNNPRNSEGAFIKLKDGRILFVYAHFTGNSAEDGVPGYLAGRYSSDGGKTWTEKDALIVPGDEALMHEVMSPSLVRLHDGRIALFYLRLNGPLDMRPVMRISSDEAKTWSKPRVCISDAEAGYYVLNNDRAVQLKSGRLVLPVARHDDLTKPDKFNHSPRTMCYLSDDNGTTWHQSKTVLTGKHGPHEPVVRTFDGAPIREVALQEPGVIELKDGRLMMFCRTHTGYAYISFSGDQGDTWSSDVPMPGILAALAAPAIKRIPTTGDLLMVWDDLSMGVPNWSPGKRTPYTVGISFDEGKTWERKKNIEDDPEGWYCYTAMEFVGDHVLLAHTGGKRDLSKNLSGLETTQVTRFNLAWLYKPTPTPPTKMPAWAKAPHMTVFVFTGQSNSVGCTANPKENDITPGKDPLDEKIPFFWSNHSPRTGDGPDILYGDSGGKIVTLRAQQGWGVDPMFWGPEIGFARSLAAAGKKDFLIVKASRGGGGNGYWLKGSSDDHMYRHVVNTVEQAVKELPTGTTFDIAALLYNQGESDVYPACGGCAAEAGQRLRTLANNLRKDLPNAAGMKVLIGGIAVGGEGREVVRAQQSALPAADPTFKYVDTLDLRSQLLPDGLHFNKRAKLELGRRMAKAWLDWEKAQSQK